ncbi:MAG: efflux RND transporter periplasmic adaptor subunit [Deltaproteobacteria bacterium]|nr:efflux RND transporter periplasmic adaptor subunit [Deltaproteobacteria bacterium]
MKQKFTSKIILFLSVLTLVSGCDSSSEASLDKKNKLEDIFPVEVAKVIRKDVYAIYNGSVTLEARDEAVAVSKSQGIIENIYYEEGDRVNSGDVLAKLDDKKILMELELSKIKLNHLRDKHTRNISLYKKNLISKEAFSDSSRDLESQKITVKLAILAFNETKIKAPISGIISEKIVKKGNMINLHERSFKITSFDPIYAKLHVPEIHLNKLKKGQSANVTINSGNTFTGEVLRISPIIDSETGTFKVTIQIKNSDSKLKPGMFSKIAISYDKHENTTLIPKEAVLLDEKRNYIFIINGDRVKKKFIETGYSLNQRIEAKGISDDCLIVTTGNRKIKHLSKVKIIKGTSNN